MASHLPLRALYAALVAVPLTAAGASDGDGFDSPLEGQLQAVTRNSPQRAIAAMVEEICPSGIARGVILSQDLQDRCTDIVQAVKVTRDTSGALDAMQKLAPEEVNTIGTTEVDSSSAQVEAVGARMQNLRAGGPRVAISMPGFSGGLLAGGDTGLQSGGSAGADEASRFGVFVNGNYVFNDKDATSNESGFKSDTYGVTAGLDYQLTDPLLVGAAFTYNSTDADIANRGGSLGTDSYGGFAYATYVYGGGWYLDAMGGYTQNTHDQTRNIAYSVLGATRGLVTLDQVASSSLDSDEVAGSLKFGFDATHGNWTVSPYVRFDASDVSIDGYSERMSRPTSTGSGLALQVDDQSFTSLMLAGGAQFGFPVAMSWGTWYPQVSAEYVHEFDNDAQPVTGRYVDAPSFSFSMDIDAPDRDFAHLGASSSFILNNGSSAFVSYQALVGYQDLMTHAVEVGLRIPF